MCIYDLDIAWQLVLYGLYSTEPKGAVSAIMAHNGTQLPFYMY